MGNVFKTLDDGDVLRRSLSMLHNDLIFCKSINREYDKSFGVTGAKNGGIIKLRDPNQFEVRTGEVMSTQFVEETTQDFVVGTIKGIDWDLSTVDRTLSIDDIEERYLKPMMSRLAAEIDAKAIANCYPAVYQFQNTTFGTKPVLADVLSAGARLNQSLAPDGDRTAMVDSLASNSIVTDSKSLFSPASEISRQYTKGKVGEVGGFAVKRSEMTPTHTTGSRDDTTPICDISSISNGDTTLTTTGGDGTVVVGDVFTIADVYDVNPETKVSYAHLKQFRYRTAKTCDATDVFDISPTIYKSGAKQNCYAAAWTGNKAIVNVAAGGSGTASTAFVNSLFFHKDAFTMATADLFLPPGGVAERKVMDGISMRLWQQGEIINNMIPLRLDVLMGAMAQRPEWAVRVCS